MDSISSDTTWSPFKPSNKSQDFQLKQEVSFKVIHIIDNYTLPYINVPEMYVRIADTSGLDICTKYCSYNRLIFQREPSL